MARRFDQVLGSVHGLGFTDFVVMLELFHAPAKRLRRVELAERVGMSASGVTRVLAPLEKVGLVMRLSDPRDARVGFAVLTPVGEERIAEAIETADGVARGYINAPSRAVDRDVLTEFVTRHGGAPLL